MSAAPATETTSLAPSESRLRVTAPVLVAAGLTCSNCPSSSAVAAGEVEPVIALVPATEFSTIGAVLR